MPSPHVGRGEPLHAGGKLPVALGPENQVPVVWHQAIGENPQGKSRVGLVKHLEKSGVVVIFLEQRQPPDAPVKHVVDEAAQIDPQTPGRVNKSLPDGQPAIKK